MRTTTVLFSCSAAVLTGGTWLVAPDARAAGPVDVEVAALVGTGANPIGNVENPLLLGVGARAGAAFRGFYAGARYMHYFAGSVGSGGATLKGDIRADLFGGELGYGLTIARVFVVRPELGVGLLSYNDETYAGVNGSYYGAVTDVVATSTSTVYFEPAVAGLASLGPLLLGADLGVLVIPTLQPVTYVGPSPSIVFHLQAGVRF